MGSCLTKPETQESHPTVYPSRRSTDFYLQEDAVLTKFARAGSLLPGSNPTSNSNSVILDDEEVGKDDKAAEGDSTKEATADTNGGESFKNISGRGSEQAGRSLRREDSMSMMNNNLFGSSSQQAISLDKHNVKIMGEGQELLVLAHSLGCSQEMWDSVLDYLDLDNYRILQFDFIGAAGSDPVAYDFQRYSSLHGYADDLLQLLDDLGVEGTEWGQQLTFVGHGISGCIGLIASTERPQIFRRIILIGSSPKYVDVPGYKGGFKLKHLDPIFAALQDNYNIWLSGCETLPIEEASLPAHVRDICHPLIGLRPDIAFSILKTIFSADVRPLLPQVTVPVHLLHTAKDSTVPWEVVQLQLDALPNAYAELLPVSRSFLDNPYVLAEAIVRHLKMPRRELLLSRSMSTRSGRGLAAPGDLGEPASKTRGLKPGRDGVERSTTSSVVDGNGEMAPGTSSRSRKDKGNGRTEELQRPATATPTGSRIVSHKSWGSDSWRLIIPRPPDK